MSHSKSYVITSLPPALANPCHLHTESPKLYTTIYELAQSNPTAALKKLDLLKTAESQNLKAYVLLQMKKLKEAEKLIEENFHNYPENLSAKINYADLCLRKKRWREIPTIFPSTDLSQLYPSQTTFSASEFRGFMVVMGFYYLRLRNYRQAEQFYTLAVKADPLHPSVALLERKLFDLPLVKAFWKIFHSC